ncbi:hypothetical protein ACQKPX_06255 [Photobacterium sp. DNB23_23_1]|nr:hypothetical protein [Photobacterium sp. ZSDE20]
MSNRRIKQMMEDINHDGLFDEAISNDRNSTVEGKEQSINEVPPNINMDSENK